MNINVLEKIRNNWQKISVVALLIGIFLLGFFVTYSILNFSKTKITGIIPTPNSFASATPAPINDAVQEKGVYNILFLGYGGAGHDGSLLTDSIIIIHLDTNVHKAALITVPRDLWVTGNHKINASGITGFQNTEPVITEVTGLPVNYYVSVDFGGFTKIIDDLGGISVNAPATFDDPFYPIIGQENNTCGMTEDQINTLKAKYSGFDLERQFTCRYEHLHFDKGPVTLDGATALKFVRSRHGDSDFGRSLRQLAVLAGIENKLISLQAAGKLNDIVNTLLNIVKTNLDAGIIKSLIAVLGDPKAYTTKQIQLTTDNVLTTSTSSDRQFILIPKAGNLNFSEVKSYIKSNF